MSSAIEPGFTAGQTIGIVTITLAVWEGGKFVIRTVKLIPTLFKKKPRPVEKPVEKPVWWDLPSRDLTEAQLEQRRAHVAGLSGRDHLSIPPDQRELEKLEILKEQLLFARTLYREHEKEFQHVATPLNQSVRDSSLAALNAAQEEIVTWYNQHEQEIPF